MSTTTRLGTLSSPNATRSGFVRLLVRQVDDAPAEYQVGDSAHSRDGWCDLPRDLLGRVEWGEECTDPELSLYLAREAHAARLVPGTRVRVMVGRLAGTTGTIAEAADRLSARWVDDDGVRWDSEPHRLEVVS